MSVPALNYKRSHASACTYVSTNLRGKVTSTVYVYGGAVSDQKNLDTIEKVGFRQPRDGGDIEFITKKWMKIHVPELSPRMYALMCPLANDEIIIYGGHDADKNACQSDGVIFSTK